MSDEFTDPIERLFYEQLVWKFEPEFVAAAESLQVSNEDLERAIAEHSGTEGLGQTFANFCRHVLTIRNLQQLVAFRRPDEESVSLVELGERMNRHRGDA